MVTRLGTILGTELGTDLGEFIDGPERFDTSQLYGLTNYALANRYATTAGGGEAGDVAGFGVVILGVVERLPTGAQAIANRQTTGEGYGIEAENTSNTVFVQMRNGVGGVIGSRLTTGLTLTASDVGKVIAVVASHTGGLVGCAAWDGSIARSTAIVGYTPATALATIMGANGAFVTIAPFAMLSYRGTPTDAQIRAVLSAARARGDVPTKAAAEAVMPGTTITHRWSLRDVLAATGVPVVSGQVAPATIPDSVTAASIDAMARTGSPTVTVIDPGIDGRKSYGALGFSTTSRLETAGGIRGGAVGGTWVAVLAELVSAANSESFAASITNPAGWDLIKYNGTLLAGRRDAGGFYVSTNPYTFTTGDVGRPILVGFHHTGTQLRTMLDGVLLGSDAAASAMQPSATPMQVGVENNTSYAATTAKIYGVVGGDGFYPTPGEWAQLYADVKRTGRIQAIPGKTTHLYDLTQDIIANGGPSAGIPATVQDRVGTDHLTRVGGLEVVTNGSATGLRGFVAATNILSTPAGFAGASAFWASALAAPQTLTGIRILFGKSNHGTAGWSFGFNGSYIVTYIADGGVNTAGPQFNMGAGSGYLNTPTHIAMVLSAGTLTLYVNGVAAGTPLAVAAYSPGTTSMVIGANNGGALHPATNVDIFGACGGHFAPTAGEIATAAAASLSTGVITAVPAKTSHRYDLKADIADAGGAVPARSIERTSGVDPMIVVNTKLEVGSRIERLWSYETTPIMYGAQGWSAANYLARAGGAGAFLATATPFWIAFAVIVPATPGASVELIFGGSTGSNPGFQVYFQVGAVQAALALSPSGAAGASAVAVSAADVGKVLLVGYQWTGSVLQTYARRAKVGSDVTAASFVPNPNGAFFLGRRYDTTSNPLNAATSVLGLMGGSSTLTLAEWQSAYDALVANEAITAIPGKTDRLWRFAQSGALGSTPDAMGNSDPITVVGSPTVTSMFARAFA